MKTIYLLILTTLLSMPFDTFAHKDHSSMFQKANISKEEASTIAQNHVALKIEKQQISDSWSLAVVSVAVMKRVNGKQVWSVHFTLPAENNPNPLKLEITISKTGDVISVSE